MDQIISVIIPVYNVSCYLKDCLNSVVNQTYKNLEIIIIDDGSTDGSQQICDEYSKMDKRIKVIHQKNSGSGAAKNAGLRLATGKYLAFVDSDDYVENNAFELMINKMIECDLDIVHCGFRNVYKNEIVEKRLSVNNVIYNANEYLEMFLKDWTCGLLWNKLYKSELFNGIFFKEGRIIDDEFFTYQGVINSSRIGCYDFIVYNYRQRKSSVMVSKENRHRIINDKIDYLEERFVKVSIFNKKLKNKYAFNLFEHFYLLLKSNSCNDKIKNKMRRILFKHVYFKNIQTLYLYIKVIIETFKKNEIITNTCSDDKCYFE